MANNMVVDQEVIREFNIVLPDQVGKFPEAIIVEARRQLTNAGTEVTAVTWLDAIHDALAIKEINELDPGDASQIYHLLNMGGLQPRQWETVKGLVIFPDDEATKRRIQDLVEIMKYHPRSRH